MSRLSCARLVPALIAALPMLGGALPPTLADTPNATQTPAPPTGLATAPDTAAAQSPAPAPPPAATPAPAPAPAPAATPPPAATPAPAAAPEAPAMGSTTMAAAPPPGKALIAFLRPSIWGGPVASSLFEIVDNKAVMVGILHQKQRLNVVVTPGTHLYMLMGESAEFMSAEVLADKTYYVAIHPHMGVWKARFTLKPVHQDMLDTKEFENWKYACALIDHTARDDEWASLNASQIEDKRAKYYPDFQKMSDAERPALRAADGR